MTELYGFEGRYSDKRRRKNGSHRSFEIKQLWQKQHEIILMAMNGYKNVDIAKKMGLTNATVGNTLNSPIVLEKLAKMRAARDADTIDVAKEIAKRIPIALKIYDEIISAPQAALSLKKSVADTILMDLGGYRAPVKVEGQFAHAHFDAEQIEKIKSRGKKAAIACGMLKVVNDSDSTK